MFTDACNKILRTAIMFQKMVKRTCRRKNPSDPFVKTVKMYSFVTQTIDVKMILDTGCEAHNLIAYQVVKDMLKEEDIHRSAQPICICLNGEMLVSIGTISLRWKGRGSRKIFETTFHIIDEDCLPSQVILGAETIKRESILRFMGFGGRTLLPKKGKDERVRADQRKAEHDKEVANNALDVVSNERARDSDAGWSNWEWDEDRQSYYRAKLVGDTWEYQYSTTPA